MFALVFPRPGQIILDRASSYMHMHTYMTCTCTCTCRTFDIVTCTCTCACACVARARVSQHTKCWNLGIQCFNAPEGCPHGTHTNRTAYTRGTHSREHTMLREQPKSRGSPRQPQYMNITLKFSEGGWNRVRLGYSRAPHRGGPPPERCPISPPRNRESRPVTTPSRHAEPSRGCHAASRPSSTQSVAPRRPQSADEASEAPIHGGSGA